MRLIFVSSGQYPNGGAAANRHLAYVKGLVELGHEVVFILMDEQQWKEPQRIEPGIKFICVAGRKRSRSSKIEKVLGFVKTISRAKQVIISTHKEDEVSSIILLDTRIPILIPLINQAKILGIKIIHERTEYPFIYGGKTIIGKIELKIYLKYVIRRFDGLYVINNALKEYFLNLTKKKIEITIINMIVDPSRFENINNRNASSSQSITYCGSLENEKDGIPILLEAFSMIADEFPFARLQLVGSSENQIVKQDLLTLTQKLGIENKVDIIGPLNRNEIPRILCDSNILALARPDNKQAEGGFPTKLGEYLATGNAVVITKVGEIDKFLKDGINAFIAEPDDAAKFAEKLREALLSGNRDKIGLEGKKLVYKEFNYLYQAKVLEEFIEKINGSNS